MRSSARWRWYRSRLGPTAVVFAILGAVGVGGALLPEERWYQKARPSPDAGLTRIESRWPGGFFLQPVVDPAPRDVRDSVLAVGGGTPLVGERLLRYADSDEARRAGEDILRRNHAGDAGTVRGFSSFRAGCAAACRPVGVGRNGDVVIVLGRLVPPGAPHAGRAERSFHRAIGRYADLNSAGSWGFAWHPVHLALIVGTVIFLFLPWLAWQGWVTCKAQRTPHQHPDAGLPEYAVDVCDTAGHERRRAHKVLSVGVGIFALTSVVAAALPLSIGLWLAFLAAPLCWLFVRRAYADRSQFATRPGVSALEGAGLFRSLRVRLEIVATNFGAVFAITCAWLLGGLMIILVAAAARSIVEEPAVGIVLALVVVVLVALFNGGPAASRIARRLRVAAARREYEHGRRASLLYLRTFDDDHRLLAAGGPRGRSATGFLTFRARIPYEEVVVRELDRFGAVEAVAEPGRPRLLPALGAARTRLSNEEWRVGVSARMREAALVVIAVGATEGLVWELEEATRQGRLDRVVVIVPPDDDDAIRARWSASLEAVSRAGGPTIYTPVDPADILLAQLDAGGLRQVIVADRRDEHAYVAALDRAIVVASDQGVIDREPAETAAAGPLGRPRGVGFGILLFFCTGGLYSLYWAFKTHEELKRHTGLGLGGELGLAVWFLGFGTSAFVIPAEVGRMYRNAARPPPVGAWTGLWVVPGVVFLIPPLVWFVQVQGALNRYWTQTASPPRR